MARATRIAAAALNGYVMGAVGMATHYHTYAVTPSWNRSLVMTDAIGAHFFHRWKGYWGTPAGVQQRALSGRRAGAGAVSQDRPGAPADAADCVRDGRPTPPIPGAAPVAKTDWSAIQPKYQRRQRRRKDDNLPGESQILDRWKDSGKPLR